MKKNKKVNLKEPIVKEKVIEVFDTEKNRTVTINLDHWCTPSQLAKEFGVTRQVVNNWQQRGKLKVLFIPDLKLTLVQVKRGVTLIK